MKILMVHNAYQHSGGEDAVVDAEISLLRQHGHDVELYGRHNDELKTMSKPAAAMSAIWSRKSTQEIEYLFKAFGPDIVHAHNTFPLISSAIYWAASRKNIPLVCTLHNFRLLCPQATLLRSGKICEDCIGKFPWRAVTRKCYRDSLSESAVTACMLGVHRFMGTYSEKVSRYIALTAFSQEKFIRGGLPASLFRIKPNFIESATSPGWADRHGGLFVGRLSAEKGIDVLIKTQRVLQRHSITVIGSGPMEAEVKACFGDQYVGFKKPGELTSLMHAALFLVVPSICYENLPRTIIEAFSCGLPVIASRLGPLVDIIDEDNTGLMFEPGNPHDLAAKIAWAESHPDEMAKMGRAARAEYEAKYTAEQNYRILIGIYQEAILEKRGERHVA